MKCINTSVCSLALNLIGIVLTKFSLLIIKIDVVCEAYYFVMYVCTYLVRDILEFLSSFEESFRRKEINVAKTDIFILALGLDNTGDRPTTISICFTVSRWRPFVYRYYYKVFNVLSFLIKYIRKTVPLSKYLISTI